MSVEREIEDYIRFCIEFCLEWSKYTEEDLLKKDEVQFFRIFNRCKEREERRARWEKENTPRQGV